MTHTPFYIFLFLVFMSVAAHADINTRNVQPGITVDGYTVSERQVLCDSVTYQGNDPTQNKYEVDVDAISFPLTLDLIEFLDLDTIEGLDGDLNLGDVTIDANGDVFIDNQRVTANVLDRCAQSTVSVEE